MQRLDTPVASPRELARQARLKYTSDEMPGFHRLLRGKGFSYADDRGKTIRSRDELARIRALVIPPAWTDVWICPHESGHLQVTGRDAKGRKQYLYHARWQELANRTKFDKLRAFGEALPGVRQQVRRHLSLDGMTKSKVVATVVELLDRTLARVGNEEYVRANDSYGLTTLRNRHAKINGTQVKLRFRGKSGKEHEIDLRDRRLARIVRACQELPGQELFTYQLGQRQFRRLESSDVNRYLQSLTSKPFTAKDFRTWKASALVLEFLHARSAEALTATEAKRVVAQAIRSAAETLGNTVTVCRNYYVHPQLVEWFLAGELSAKCGRLPTRSSKGLEPYEQLLLKLLKRMER
jgi:DNA topoisomerase-1